MTTDMIEEAIECLLEGSAITKPCKHQWGKTTELQDCSPQEVYKNADNVEYTCVEGALIIGAKLRGHSFDEAMDLLKVIDVAAIGDDWYEDAAVLLGINDSAGRDAAVAYAKELRK